MNKEPIISNTPVSSLEHKEKKNDFKLIAVIAGGAVLLAATLTFLVFFFLQDDSEFKENGGKNLENLSASKYINLENFDLSFEELDEFYDDEIEDKITLLFTYLKPDIKTLTVEKVESSKTPAIDEEEEIGDSSNKYKITIVSLRADTGERFFLKISIPENLNVYELSIEDDRENELYSYSSGSITKSPYVIE